MGDNNKSNPIAIGAKFDWSSAEKANENYRQLVKAREELYTSFGKNAKEISSEDTLYKALTETINKLTPAIEDYQQKLKDFAGNDLYIKYNESTKKNFLSTEEDVKKFANYLENAYSMRKYDEKTMQEVLSYTDRKSVV